MKIRYYQKIDGWRWLGFILAMLSAFTLSGGNPTTPAAAVAIVSGTAINTKNVPLPFGGFPGASLY